MFTSIARFVLVAYFHCALRLGFHRHVYRLADRWARLHGPVKLARHEAANAIQIYLLQGNYGYHHCPSCYWATEKPNEHIERGEGYCWEQTLPVCHNCGGPQPLCVCATLADIAANDEAQRIRQEEIAAWEWFEAEQERQLLEKARREEEEDAEWKCSTCGVDYEECGCYDDEGTADDAATDFYEHSSPPPGAVILKPGHPDYDEEQFEQGDCLSCGGNSSECFCE